MIFRARCINDASDDFSFSGLKTSVRYFLRDHPALLDDAQKIRDLCASVQAAIVEVLVQENHPRREAEQCPLRDRVRRRDLQPRVAKSN